MRRIILAFAVLAIAMPATPAETKKPNGSVNVRASAKQPTADGKQVIEFTMTISPGWHVYANPPGHEKYESVKTRLVFVGDNKPKVVGSDFPPGKPMEEDGVKFQGYEGEVQFRATVERTGDKPLEVEVRFMACNDLNCIPSKIKLTVP
jgi:DsbC/DsbD-like thiol-disulfide interchange protein